MNTQKAETPNLTQAEVEVHSIFFTIQGEGPFVGCPAVFVRLAGCNLQCPWCDTEYTNRRELMRPHQIFDEIQRVCLNIRSPLIVITGGEPFRQDGISQLVVSLTTLAYTVQIETNGTREPYEFPWGLATVVCSPKTSHINQRVLEKADCFKYVVNHGAIAADDGLPLTTLGRNELDKVARPRSGAPVYVQPADELTLGSPLAKSLNELNIEAAVASCLKYGYRLCLQTHKIANLP